VCGAVAGSWTGTAARSDSSQQEHELGTRRRRPNDTGTAAETAAVDSTTAAAAARGTGGFSNGTGATYVADDDPVRSTADTTTGMLDSPGQVSVLKKKP